MSKEKLVGDRTKEYGSVCDYTTTLLEHTPGSTVVVHVYLVSSPLRPRFERLYVYVKTCASGLRNGCRPFIAMYECLLKGPDGGQLICVVTRDADNALFPVDFAWVEVENHNSWKLFLEILVRDIGTHRRWKNYIG